MEILFQLYTLIFVFSIIGILKYTVSFLVATFSNPPKKIEFTDREITILGFFISYIITYIIFL
jgi:hypothetical protein